MQRQKIIILNSL